MGTVGEGNSIVALFFRGVELSCNFGRFCNSCFLCWFTCFVVLHLVGCPDAIWFSGFSKAMEVPSGEIPAECLVVGPCRVDQRYSSQFDNSFFCRCIHPTVVVIHRFGSVLYFHICATTLAISCLLLW